MTIINQSGNKKGGIYAVLPSYMYPLFERELAFLRSNIFWCLMGIALFVCAGGLFFEKAQYLWGIDASLTEYLFALLKSVVQATIGIYSLFLLIPVMVGSAACDYSSRKRNDIITRVKKVDMLYGVIIAGLVFLIMLMPMGLLICLL